MSFDTQVSRRRSMLPLAVPAIALGAAAAIVLVVAAITAGLWQTFLWTTLPAALGSGDGSWWLAALTGHD
jgi:hypothetical protein